MKRMLVGIVAVLLAGAAGYYGWTQYAGGEAPRLAVQTATLQRGDVRHVISTSGTVKARVTVDVSVQVSGQISERPVDYNSIVKKGDLLARIDPAPFQTKIRQLEASIAIAEAGVAIATANLSKANINADKTASDLDRNQKLATTGAVTKAALETAQNADKLARADLLTANAQLQDANASLQQRRAEMESAEIDLQHAEIRAPIDGIVVDRLVEVGQTVAASSTAPKLFTLAQDLSNIDITAQVDESDVAQVASNDPVTFRVDAFPDTLFRGEVWQVRLAPMTQQNVVTYTVVMRATNPGGRLLPGMTANLDIVTGERRGVLVAPNEALRFQPRGAATALVRAATPAGAAPPPSGAVSNADPVARLQRDLDLDDATAARIRAALSATPGVAALSAAPTETRVALPAVQPGQAAAATLADQRNGVRAGPGGRPPGAPTPGAAAGGAGRGADAARIEQVLRDILTPEQLARFQSLQTVQDTPAPSATLWTREADGSLVSHQVRLGLVSLNQTEIIATDIAEGAPIVLTVRETKK